MSFAAPERLWWLLVLLPLVGVLLVLSFQRRRARARLADAVLWEDAFDRDPFAADLLKGGLVTLSVASLLLALARPQWGFTEVPVPTSGVDVLVAVDVSKSMLSRDVPPDRLGLVRKELRGLFDSLAESRVGLVGFAGRPTILVPLTSDLSAVSSFLDVLSPDVAPVPGTDLGAALDALTEVGRVSDRRKVAILLTDGGDLEGKAKASAASLRGKGIDLFVVGVGGDHPVPILLPDGSTLRDPEGNIVTTRLEEDDLQGLASAAGGTYLRLELGKSSLSPVLERLHALRGGVRKDGKRLEAVERAEWFALLSALFLIAEMAVPGAFAKRRRE